MTIKKKITNRINVCGAHVNVMDPMITEIIASLGYDFLFVDMEHTNLTWEHVYYHLLAAKVGGTPVFVRVPADDLTATKKVLEMGIDGIIFPMVRDAAHAKQLLDTTLYPPYGKRGFGPKGAIRYGLDSEEEFCKKGHLNLCRFVQIELESAAKDAQNIAALPYLDGCILGMNDLSGSINRLGDTFCDENMTLAKQAVEACKNAGLTIGVATFATDEETLKRYYNMGINMISTGADFEYILRGARNTLQTLKKICDE